MRRRYANEEENKLTHALCRIRGTRARRHNILTFSIYTCARAISFFVGFFFFALWHVRAHTQGQECAVKSDIKLKSHFLIIHKYPSLSVHECHVNEHTGGRAGRGRVGGERGDWEREKDNHHWRKMGREGERERGGMGEKEGERER